MEPGTELGGTASYRRRRGAQLRARSAHVSSNRKKTPSGSRQTAFWWACTKAPSNTTLRSKNAVACSIALRDPPHACSSTQKSCSLCNAMRESEHGERETVCRAVSACDRAVAMGTAGGDDASGDVTYGVVPRPPNGVAAGAAPAARASQAAS